MKIAGFQKLTLLDYPGHIACLIFTQGCNLRCPFCHNSSLVLANNDLKLVTETEVFNYLKKRKGILDGVVISGGEPLLQKDLKEFLKKIKNLGYKIKLDTNGTNPTSLKELIKEKLLDYVAMDIKNDLTKYELTVGGKIAVDSVIKSIQILKISGISYEFRTTVTKEFHQIDDIRKILMMIGKSNYYLQNFKDSQDVIQTGLHSFSRQELEHLNDELKEEFPNFKIRDLEFIQENEGGD